MSSVSVGQRVRVIDANPSMPWKRDFIGSTGTVDEVSSNGKAIAVRLDDDRPNRSPVWMSRDCLATIISAESK